MGLHGDRLVGVIWGQFYENYFWGFCPIFGEKLGVFLDNFFSPIFW
jgi:hypothetical protein